MALRVARMRRTVAPCLALVAVCAPAILVRSQDKEIVRGTPALPREGGITAAHHQSEHEHGLRVLGSVHVGPPVVLLEAIAPYTEGAEVVPISYSFLTLHGSEWRHSSDQFCFRAADGRDVVGGAGSLRGGTDEDVSMWQELSIRPRDELSWSEVRTKLDVVIEVDVTRSE